MLAKVIQYLYPQADMADDVRIVSDGAGERIEAWSASLGAQPTQQVLDDAEASPEFSAWLTENGGDATATLRRQTRDASSAPLPNAVLYRAAFLVMVDEFNRHTVKFTALRDAIANASSLADVKAAAAAIDPLPARTGQDLRDAAIVKIDSGAADS